MQNGKKRRMARGMNMLKKGIVIERTIHFSVYCLYSLLHTVPHSLDLLIFFEYITRIAPYSAEPWLFRHYRLRTRWSSLMNIKFAEAIACLRRTQRAASDYWCHVDVNLWRFPWQVRKWSQTDTKADTMIDRNSIFVCQPHQVLTNSFSVFHIAKIAPVQSTTTKSIDVSYLCWEFISFWNKCACGSDLGRV